MERLWPIRVLTASIVKEWLVRRRYPLLLWSWFLWPILFVFGLIFTARALAGPGGYVDAFARNAGTADYTGFMAMGVATWMTLNWMLWTLGTSLRREQQLGTLEVLWMTPVPRVFLMLGRGVADLLQAVLLFAFALIEFNLLFGLSIKGSIGTLGVVLAATLPSLYGMGLAFASLVLWVKEANGAVFFVRGIFTLFAGLTYPLAVLPGWMRAVAEWLPLTYTVEGVRQVALNGASLVALGPILLPLLGFGAFFLVVGQAAFTWTERRVKRLGTLGAF
ncbi:MAG: ABC transporter permease [Armatimonadota bacterium]